MKKMAAEPVTKKSKKEARFYDSHYKEEWAESYPVGLVNGNTGAFVFFTCKKSVELYASRLGRCQTTLFRESSYEKCKCYNSP